MDQRVEIHGTSRADMNGKCGVATDFHPMGGPSGDRTTWRYTVKLDDGEETWWVEPMDIVSSGLFLGAAGFVRGFLASKLEKFEAFLAGVERTVEEAAPDLPRAQSGNLLLRACGLGRLFAGGR